MVNKLYELFADPTAAYRGKPFWSWNGKLDKEELLRQIHVFKEMGFGGFFMHSRTGLVTEYLGDEWFELINACAEEAEKLGLEAWLYDEDRWPSGSAGGLVTEEPKYRLKFIRLETIQAEQFDWDENVFAAFLCGLEEMTYSNCKPLDRNVPDWKQEGRTILAFSIAEQAKETFYNGFTYLDTLNREAVDKFLEITHEKYKSESGKHFGKSIKGIFTDEPHRGALMDGFGMKNEDGHWHAPWTYTLFETFKDRYGYELIPHLPELFLLPEGKEMSQVKWHYVDLIQEMFHDNFAKPINEWCERNDLILTGHTLHEDSLTAQTAMVGSHMRFYEHMGYPGVDVLSEGNINYWIVKQLTSAARQLGKTWLLSELYGCTGWQMSLEGHKAVGDWQALFGINLRCHHLSWYSMQGEAKRDFPASISYQSAWWEDYNYVESYFSRLGVIMTNGSPVCDLLVINPIESLWGQIYPGWSRGLSARSNKVQELEQIYRDTFHWLAGAQIDFDYGDEEMLSRLHRVGKDEEGTAVLHVGQATYRVVLITGMMTMRASTLRMLMQFKEAGGQVIFAGDAPGYMDAAVSGEVIRFASTVDQVPFEQKELVYVCRQAVRTLVTVSDATTGAPIPDIYAQVRKDDEHTYIVLMNMNRSTTHSNVSVRFQGAGIIEEWDCATSTRRHVAAAKLEGASAFITDFVPIGEHVYVFSAGEKSVLPKVHRYFNVDAAELTGPYLYRLSEPNVCVLDQVAFRLGEDEESEIMEILQADRQIRGKLQLPIRHGEMIQPWYAQKFDQTAFEKKSPLTLQYRFQVKDLPETAVYLALESPEEFKVTLNGVELDCKDMGDWWVDRCFVKVQIPIDLLCIGENRLEFYTLFHQGINLEAVYLLGEFGVSIEGERNALTSLPDHLSVGCITKQGFPFYGGIITYISDISNDLNKLQSELRPEEVESERVMVTFASFEAGCIKVRSGDDEQTIAWQPYEAEFKQQPGHLDSAPIEIDLVLTRRNTFGPLHQLPLLTSSYGPGNWTTGGVNFSNKYVLLPTGLLQAPKLVVQHSVVNEGNDMTIIHC